MPLSLAEFGSCGRGESAEVIQRIENGGRGGGCVEGGEDGFRHGSRRWEVKVRSGRSGRVGDDESYVQVDVRLGRD